jgi:tetratricopeptide (TPR) repeat protein
MLETTMAEKQQPTCGVFYVATYQERFIVEAAASAKSLKKYCPELSVTLCTNMPDSQWVGSSCFDQVLTIEAEDGEGTEWGRGVLSRVSNLLRSPYDRTFHADTDTRFLDGEVLALFDVLDDYDIAIAEDSPKVSIGVAGYEGRMFNVGAILYRKCDKINALFTEWKNLFQIQLAAYSQDPLPLIPYMSRIKDVSTRRKLMTHDQLALVQLLGPDTNTMNVSCKVLDEQWNFCRPLNDSQRAITHLCHGNNLKTDFYSRPSLGTKANSQHEFIEKCVEGLAKIKIAAENNNQADVLETIENGLRMIPNQSIANLPLARERMKNGQFVEAQKHAEKAINADVNCYEGFFELAGALINQQNISEAANIIRRCRSRFPTALGILALADIVQHENPTLLSLPEAVPDYNKFLRQFNVPLPPVFKEELAGFIQHHRNLAFDKVNDERSDVYQTRYLDAKTDPVVGEFQAIIQPLIGKYLKHIADFSHAITASIPKKLNLNIWGGVIKPGEYFSFQQGSNKNLRFSGLVFLRIPQTLKQEPLLKLECGRPLLNTYDYSYLPEVRSFSAVDSFIFPSHYWCQITENTSLDDCVFVGFDLLGL